MKAKERAQAFVNYFSKEMPVPETELQYKNVFELLVAVILSAQCTDKRVNLVTPELFKDFPNAKALASAEPEVVFEKISSISYPNNKAKHLVGMAKILMDEFGGKVPSELKDLVRLPGVGRKTANVVTSVWFGQDTMPVDTHVFRVSARIGLTRAAKTPAKAEKQLMAVFPPGSLARAHHWLILHGRYTCKARKPDCEHCGITSICSWYFRKKMLSGSES